MKRLICLAMLLVAGLGAATAQNYVVVDSEKIFKSLTEYNAALSELDALAAREQKNVDAKFAQVETLYNNYMQVKNSLSAVSQQARENQILATEKEAQEYQESVFGNEGTLMKRRLELIQPIQKRVFAAIEAYAERQGVDLVLDSASNPTMLYRSAGVDKTEEIIRELKQLNN